MKLKITLILSTLTFAAFAADTNTVTQSQPATAVQIERGKYLVERVAMCAECHSPRLDNGAYDRAHWLQGNVLEFQPTHPMPFAMVAPPIVGLPSYAKDEQAVKFFETGLTTTGKPAQPPMPQFRFSHGDAVAVVAYLRSLKSTDP